LLMRRDNFTLRTESEVLRINTDSTGKKATGVTYVDAAGVEWEQPAELVILTAFILWNVQLLLTSGIGTPYDPRTGQGTVGRNYAYQTSSGVGMIFDDSTKFNPFIGAGALSQNIDDFNGDNFDHGPLGFVGGGNIAVGNSNGRPIQNRPTAPGAPRWGSAWKHAAVAGYQTTTGIGNQGSSYSYRDCYLDLDPTYTDRFGRKLMRLTFDWHENERKMANYAVERMAEIATTMKPKQIIKRPLSGSYSIVPYQTTHNTGGAVMGSDPKTSVVNRYLQSWDVPNLFVIGASAFPQNHGYNPTGTVGALAYWAANAIRTQYLKSPGPLVQA
jgi:gluconate 2-dehydrogenase alpha chain